MTVKIAHEVEVDDIGFRLLDYFLEDDNTINLFQNIYFDQLDPFQQIEVLEEMKIQFNDTVDDKIKNIKKEICNG